MSLASAIADEWRAQGDDIDPATLPLFSLSVTVVDRVIPQRDAIIAELSAYGEMIFYVTAMIRMISQVVSRISGNHG